MIAGSALSLRYRKCYSGRALFGETMQTSTFLRTATCAFLAQFSVFAFALDPLSYARYDQVKTTALHMDLKADFAKKTLSGHADLTLEWIDKSARTLDLDTRELKISKIEAQGADGKWSPVKFTLDKADTEKGQALHIALGAQPGKVRIHYRTAPTAAALQWLNPVQTLSGKRPFMFSQSQSIDARSWVPVQDTPAVRFTYTARIDAPKGLRVVMSADNDAKADGKGGWRFNMPQPIRPTCWRSASARSITAPLVPAAACTPSRSASPRRPTNLPTPRK